MEASCSRFTAAEGGARLAMAASDKNILAVEYSSFIATRLIHEDAYKIRGSLFDGSQRSIYVTRASRVACVSYELKIMTDLKVVGAVNVSDVYDWCAEMETKEVLVCTSSVLKHILEEETLSMENINILIIDSCHLVWRDDNLQFIMNIYKECDTNKRPRILALTYPLFSSNKKDLDKKDNENNQTADSQENKDTNDESKNTEVTETEITETKVTDSAVTESKVTEIEVTIKNEKDLDENLDDYEMYEKLEWKIEELEKELCCEMDLAEDIDSGKRLSYTLVKPKELVIEYSEVLPYEVLPEAYKELDTYMRTAVNDALQFLDEHRYDPTEIYGEDLYEEFKNIPDPTIEPKDIFKQFLYILDQLGPYAADKAAFSLLSKLEKLKIKVPYERHFILLCLCTTVFVKIRCFADFMFSKFDSDWDKIKIFSTPKVMRFAEILIKFQPPELQRSIAENTAKMLSDLDKCDFVTLGNKIEDKVNILEANLKDLDLYCDEKSDEKASLKENSEDFDVNNDDSIVNRIIEISSDINIYYLESANKSKSVENKIIELNADNNTTILDSAVNKNIPNSVDTNTTDLNSANRAENNSEDPNIVSNGTKTISDNTDTEIVLDKDSNRSKNVTDSKVIGTTDSNSEKDSAYESVGDKEVIEENSMLEIDAKDICVKSVSDKNDISTTVSESGKEIIGDSENDSNTFVQSVIEERTVLEKDFHIFTKATIDRETTVTRGGRRGGRTRGRGRAARGGAARMQQLQQNPDALCGIVYMKEALMAKIMFMLIVDMCRAQPSLSYLCAQYCALDAAGVEPKDSQRHGKKHEEVLKKFRMHECNLLLATSALEEGIDLPRCNLVLRWDLPPSYRSYGLSRGRARASRASCVVLCTDGGDAPEKLLHQLCTYRQLDQIISNKCGCGIQNEPPETEENAADTYTLVIKPYTPQDTDKTRSNSNPKTNDHKVDNSNKLDDNKVENCKRILPKGDSEKDIVKEKDSENKSNPKAIVHKVDNSNKLEDNKAENCMERILPEEDSTKDFIKEENSTKNINSDLESEKDIDSTEFNNKCDNEISNEKVTDKSVNIICNKCNKVKISDSFECSCVVESVSLGVSKTDSKVERDKKGGDCDLASVDLSSAIALINRYCGKLPSDTFTRLAPQWWMEEVQLPVPGREETRTAFVCTLRLPLNCPVKYNIVGHPMPTRVLARRMVALQACRILHKSGELDNQLMPIGKENFKAADLDTNLGCNSDATDASDAARPGTTKRRQYYFKKTAWAFTDCQPIVDSTDADIESGEAPKVNPEPSSKGIKRNMLYAIVSKLWCALPERYNTRGRRLHAPQHASQAIGILMAREHNVE